MPSRYSRIAVSGLPYDFCSSPSTMGAWLTPSPSTNRPGNASESVCQPELIMSGMRPWIDAMPVATVSRSVAERRRPACTSGSRPTASGSHTAP